MSRLFTINNAIITIMIAPYFFWTKSSNGSAICEIISCCMGDGLRTRCFATTI